MLTVLNLRLFNIWILVLLFCAGLAELGRITGNVQRPILDDFFHGASSWWNLPAAVHFSALLFLAGVFFLISRRALRGFSLPHGKSMRVLAVVIIILSIFLCFNQFSELKNVVFGATDFGTIYQGGEALYDDVDPYTATHKSYFYPPLLAFLFGPLLLLPKAGASTLFFSIKFILVVWTLLACDQLVGGARFKGSRRALFITGLIFVGSRFWVADLQFGNTNVVILFLMIAAILFDRKNNVLMAGVVLALAVSIKIIPAVLCLHFLVTRRWRTLMFFFAAMVGFAVLPWLVLQGFWWESWSYYFDVGVTGKLSERLGQPDNQSLWGMINRIFPVEPLGMLRWFWMGLSTVLIAFAGYISFRSRNSSALTQVAAASLYPLLGLLISPGSWVVHYSAVLLPMAVLLTVALDGLGPKRTGWMLFFATNFAFTLSGWSRPTVNASIAQSWFVMAAVLLMVGVGVWALNNTSDRSELVE